MEEEIPRFEKRMEDLHAAVDTILPGEAYVLLVDKQDSVKRIFFASPNEVQTMVKSLLTTIGKKVLGI